MLLFDSMQGKATSVQSATTNAATGRPVVWRRALAALIDRLAPLPFLAFFVSEWALLELQARQFARVVMDEEAVYQPFQSVVRQAASLSLAS